MASDLGGVCRALWAGTLGFSVACGARSDGRRRDRRGGASGPWDRGQLPPLLRGVDVHDDERGQGRTDPMSGHVTRMFCTVAAGFALTASGLATGCSAGAAGTGTAGAGTAAAAGTAGTGTA